MVEYHKIKTVFERDPNTRYKSLLEGKFSLPEFEYLKDNEWIFTEKVDGTCIRVVFDGKDVRFGGKTDNAQIPAILLSELMNMFCRGNKLKENFPDGGICLYGEGYGANIQKGGGNYIPDNCSFVLFDVLIDKWWLRRKDVDDIANKLNIKSVPIIGSGTLTDMVEMCRGGFNSQWGDFVAEGIVARPKVEMFNRGGERIITKIKYKDFIKEVK